MRDSGFGAEICILKEGGVVGTVPPHPELPQAARGPIPNKGGGRKSTGKGRDGRPLDCKTATPYGDVPRRQLAGCAQYVTPGLFYRMLVLFGWAEAR